MNLAGSDVIGVVVAIITIAAGFYSAKKERDRKRDASRSRINPQAPEQEAERPQAVSYVHPEEEPEPSEVDDLFDFIFSKAAGQKNQRQEEVVEVDDTEVEKPVPEKSTAVVYNNALESVENTFYTKSGVGRPDLGEMKGSLSGFIKEESGVLESKTDTSDSKQLKLKEKLKQSPRDVIIFSEILRPKFKNF